MADPERKETREEQLRRIYPNERGFLGAASMGELMAELLVTAGILVRVDPDEPKKEA